ncbi:MAG: GIDE domain-containing protein [Myxococcota bacterium]
MLPAALWWMVSAIVGSAAAYWFSPGRVHRRTLRDAKPCTIDSFPNGGYKRIVGRAVVEEQRQLIAPLSGRPCAAYEVLVQGLDAATDERWDTVAYEMQAVPFVIEDDGGRARVDPAWAKLLITLDRNRRSGGTDPATPAEVAFLARHGEHAKTLTFNRNLRYREGVLEHGELVSVLGRGTVSYEDGAGTRPHVGGYRAHAERVRRVDIAATQSEPLLITDDPTVTGA